MWKNTETSYGVVSKVLHWVVALVVFGLFALGLWMVELDYYHAWYRKGPDLHRSMGVLLMLVVVLRLGWITFAGKPRPPVGHHHWEILLARMGHALMYLMLVALGISGYLISTADGRAVDVFSWFSVPSSGAWVENQEDIAGEIHEWLAYLLITLAVVHVLAALKHQFIDKDDTLKRMF